MKQPRFQYTPEALPSLLAAQKGGFAVTDYKAFNGSITPLVCACDECQVERTITWGEWNRVSGQLTCAACQAAKKAFPKQPRSQSGTLQAAYDALTPAQRAAVDADIQERAKSRLALGVSQSATETAREMVEAIEMAGRGQLKREGLDRREPAMRHEQYASPRVEAA